MLIEQMWILTLIALWVAGKIYQEENDINWKVRLVLGFALISGITACIVIILPKFYLINFLRLILFILGCLEVIEKEFWYYFKETLWIEVGIVIIAFIIGLNYFICQLTKWYWAH